jgi:tripartite-type tricarboxylate transporter receptor subunit TctC
VPLPDSCSAAKKALFDHLVGAGEQRVRHGQAERLGGLEIDREPVLRRRLSEVPELLVSHPSAPFETFAGFVEYAKKHPGKLNYSSAGNGTLPHVTMELLLRRTGVEVAHIPYRGAAPAMTDLLAGQVQLKMDTYTTANQHVAQGKLRALAFASRERSTLMPNVPTVAEMGLPGYEGILWIGIVAPAGTPKPVIEKLASAFQRAVRTPDLAERLKRDGVEPVGNAKI